MALSCFLPLLILFLYTNAQTIGQSGAPSFICIWSQARIALIRDHIYIDGGRLTYTDSRQNIWTSFNDSVSVSVNLSTAFNVATDNLTLLLEPLSLTPRNKNYYSGFIFTDDNSFYTFGGLAGTPVTEFPPANFIYAFNLYPSNNEQNGDVLEIGPFPANLSDGMNRYVTDGAGASAVSERLAFYFGGMTATDSTSFNDGTAQVPSRSLITMNLSQPGVLESSHADVPDFVLPSADGELLWLPTSSQGMLVSLGGVINPENLFADSLNETQIAESKKMSPLLMSTIYIYDVGSTTWYNQSIATGTVPGQLTQFCAVMATDTDSSTYDIYIYGGYDGLDAIEGGGYPTPSGRCLGAIYPIIYMDKGPRGNSTDGRLGHTCVSPYPNQMWAIGGQPDIIGGCLKDSFIKIFNLNALTWQDEYDPVIWDKYHSPAVVQAALASAEASGATFKGMPADMSPKLKALLNTSYPKPIKVYYPYVSGSQVGREIKNFIKQVFSSWLGGYLGVILYLVVSTVCVVSTVLVRRRMLLRRNGAEPLGSADIKHSRLVRWMNNMSIQSGEKEALMGSEGDLSFDGKSNTSAAVAATRLRNFAIRRNKTDSERGEQILNWKRSIQTQGEWYELRSQEFSEPEPVRYSK